jgi:acyl-CoA synthetase (AMP-forming)/AMP-acid ligase II
MTEVLPTYDFQIQHGLQYPSFTPPPLDGSLTLAQIVDWHAERSKDHVYATFATSEGLREVTWGELGAAVHRAARTLLRDVPKPGVIAVLANRDTLTYVTLFLAILRAVSATKSSILGSSKQGGVPCLLSPRNSAAGVVHLLQNTEATHIYGSEGEAEAQLIREVLATPEASSVKLLQAPVFEDLYNGIQDEGNTLPDLAASDPEATTIILHSSGSTAFPKPIRFSQSVVAYTRREGGNVEQHLLAAMGQVADVWKGRPGRRRSCSTRCTPPAQIWLELMSDGKPFRHSMLLASIKPLVSLPARVRACLSFHRKIRPCWRLRTPSWTAGGRPRRPLSSHRRPI